MKLSEKGKSRIHEMIDCAFEAHPDDAKGVQVLVKKYLTECDDFELQPDDFQDMVILTIEEAKQVKTFLDDAIVLHDKGVVIIQSTGFDTVQLIKDRIKQAEVCNERT